jgi:hypothetical protein
MCGTGGPPHHKRHSGKTNDTKTAPLARGREGLNYENDVSTEGNEGNEVRKTSWN